MAQTVVHHVKHVLALGGVPLFLTDGFKEYRTALLAHFGHWVQPARRQAQGPTPQPRWRPLPQLLYALCPPPGVTWCGVLSGITSAGITLPSSLLRAHASDHMPPAAFGRPSDPG